MKPIVCVTNIEKSFGGVRVLNGVSLRVDEGEIHCLAGENGCGKSTLIKIISGVYPHDAGEIELNGRAYHALSPIDAIREGVQVIYQDFSLFPNLTVAENLALNDQVESGRGLVNWRRVDRIAKESLALVEIEMDTAKTVEELPVSGKQLVAIARAVYCNARLIVMDEPTTALTQKEINSLLDLIRRLKGRGISTLFVSHKMREMLDVTEKITIMRNGAVVANGDTKDFDEARITQAMTGRDIRAHRFAWKGAPQETPLLELRNFGKKDAFEGIDLSLHRGEVVGVTGLLGSGRTELAEALFGRNPADEGTMWRDGQEVSVQTIQDAMAHGIAYVPEDRLTEGLFLEQSIERNLFANCYARFKNFLGLLDGAKIRVQTADSIQKYGVVASDVSLPVRSLSGGNQQKVVLARWMSIGAEVLVLNGPTVGVDVGARFDIYKKLRDIAAQGIGILMFSDDLQELVANCNRIFVIHNGRFTCELDCQSLEESDLARQLAPGK